MGTDQLVGLFVVVKHLRSAVFPPAGNVGRHLEFASKGVVVLAVVQGIGDDPLMVNPLFLFALEKLTRVGVLPLVGVPGQNFQVSDQL